MKQSDKQDILDAIQNAMDVNTKQHDDIIEIATISGKLSAMIQRGFDALAGFKLVTKWFGQTVMMGGMFYLIFKDAIHSLFG